MTTALRPDALRTTTAGLELDVGLPWIRSLALDCVLSLELVIDGEPVGGLSVILDGRPVAPVALGGESGWWFLQDRLLLAAPRPLAPGEHRVEVALELLVPYLSAGGDQPLIVPVRVSGLLKV
ncbi:hypothetical protein C5C39_01855 [Rathayibacter sp. AY1F3]|uniref:hypothetical protein n=1 Tax=Rathayibacter sp. AY1F3 TaxID=2080558 RepID=UPI000CE8F4F9|nr:hypothetical protein [Rathayibacter sp. AY1F3]PPG92779.1 hypothetical protein C5C39_01855 [Rathayibacter sp. AY1F3]